MSGESCRYSDARIHRMCAKTVDVCPNCGDGWLPQYCVVCQDTCEWPLGSRGVGEFVQRTDCCGVDVHSRCFHHLFGQRCPKCNLLLDNYGFPYPPKSVEEFIECHRAF